MEIPRQFEPDISNLQAIQNEQLLRELRAYEKGVLCMSAMQIERAQELRAKSANNEAAAENAQLAGVA